MVVAAVVATRLLVTSSRSSRSRSRSSSRSSSSSNSSSTMPLQGPWARDTGALYVYIYICVFISVCVCCAFLDMLAKTDICLPSFFGKGDCLNTKSLITIYRLRLQMA